MPAKDVVVLGGPNGAAKTTASRVILPEYGLSEFVNADIIAQDIAPSDPEAAAVAAGRIMIERMRALAAEGQSFAFETTLASRTFAPFLRDLKAQGYNVHLVYLWLPDPEESVRRVARRVARGGHNIPHDVIRRRYYRGIRNFFTLYRPVVTTWRLYENSGASLLLIAEGGEGETQTVYELDLWRIIQGKVVADDS